MGALIPALSSALGLALHDVLLTRDEYEAMAAGLADSDAPFTGTIAFFSVSFEARVSV